MIVEDNTNCSVIPNSSNEATHLGESNSTNLLSGNCTDCDGRTWYDINIKQPTSKDFIRGESLVLVKDVNENRLTEGFFAEYHSGQGECWFLKNGKEVRVTHWRSA